MYKSTYIVPSDKNKALFSTNWQRIQQNTETETLAANIYYIEVLMGALARFLGGPGVVSPPATDSAGSVYVYAYTQESRSSALAGA